MLFTDTLLGESPEWGEYAYRECSKGVDPLVAGEAVLVNRYELPDGHPLAAPAGGHPCDWLELGADDVLRLADRSESQPRQSRSSAGHPVTPTES